MPAQAGGKQVTTSTVFEMDATIYARWMNTVYAGGGSLGSSSGRQSIAVSTPAPARTPTPADNPAQAGAPGAAASAITTPKDKPPVLNPGRSSTLPGGGIINLPNGGAIDVQPRTAISGDGKTVTIPRGWEGVEIIYPSGQIETVEPGCEISLDNSEIPRVPLNFPFIDVSPSAWHYEDVVHAYIHGLFSGTASTTFSSGAPITRGMAAALHRLAGEPEIDASASPFDDVDPGAYYAKPIAWAKSNGIVFGAGNTLFCSRQANVTSRLACCPLPLR